MHKRGFSHHAVSVCLPVCHELPRNLWNWTKPTETSRISVVRDVAVYQFWGWQQLTNYRDPEKKIGALGGDILKKQKKAFYRYTAHRVKPPVTYGWNASARRTFQTHFTNVLDARTQLAFHPAHRNIDVPSCSIQQSSSYTCYTEDSCRPAIIDSCQKQLSQISFHALSFQKI